MMTKTDSTRPVQDDLSRVMLCDLGCRGHDYKGECDELMKGLKKRWLKRLFLCLRTEADNIVDAVNGLLRWLGAVRCQATVVLCRPVFAADWHFA